MRSKTCTFFVVIIFILFGHSSLSAQNWFKENTEWVHALTNGFSAYTGYEQIVVQGDTIHDGVPCKHLSRWQETVYYDHQIGGFIPGSSGPISSLFAYEEGEKVYMSDGGAFYLQYDFTMEVGDTMELEWEFLSCPFWLILDSLDFVEIQATPKRRQFFRVLEGNPLISASRQMIVIESIGVASLDPDSGWSDDFGHLVPGILLSSAESCVQDGDIYQNACFTEYDITFQWMPDCYPLPETVNSTNDISLSEKVRLSQNTAQSLLRITFPEELELKTFKAFTISGQLVLIEKSDNKEYNIKHLPSGIYVVVLEFSEGIAVKEIVKF